jgi:uncharacterized protein
MIDNVNIAEQTGYLIKLQDIDLHIYKLKAEAEERPKDIAVLKDELGSKKAGIKQAEDRIKTLQLKHKEKEIALDSKEGEIKKLEGQLYQIKTNKEYSAMINEIESRKADNSLLEEEIINLMDSVDQARSDLEGEKERFNRESNKIERQIKDIEKDISDIKSDITEFNKKRQGLLPLLDGKLLTEYERILSGRDGQALARVVNGACGGCYMKLPPQVINEIRMKHSIIRCENCQRMLYISDEETD